MGQHRHPAPSTPRDAAPLPRGHCFSHQGRQHVRLSMSAKHPRAHGRHSLCGKASVCQSSLCRCHPGLTAFGASAAKRTLSRDQSAGFSLFM